MVWCRAALVGGCCAALVAMVAMAAAEPHRDGTSHRHGPAEARGAAPRSSGEETPARERADGADHQHGIESENLFGFTAGSDTAEAGAFGLALEGIGRIGKREGRYSAIGKKLELSYGVTGDVSVAFSVLTDYHRVAGVNGFEDARTFGFNGVGGELRWRLLKRGPAPVGVTLHLEPARQRYDELTGRRAAGYGAENKLIFDTELVPDRIFAALNVLYDLERVRERGRQAWEEGSTIGLAAAATVQVAPQAFVGGEVRYLRAYEGLLPKTFAGDAVFVGPTFFRHFASNAWIMAAWNVQVAGHTVGQPGRSDLVNFERQQFRVKIGIEFEPAGR